MHTYFWYSLYQLCATSDSTTEKSVLVVSIWYVIYLKCVCSKAHLSLINIDGQIFFTSGILELIPAITFLFIMHPQMNPRDRSYSPTPEIPHHSLSQSGSGLITLNFRATEIDGLLSSSQSSGQLRRDTPLVLQHKGNTGYGAATIGSNEVSTKI